MEEAAWGPRASWTEVGERGQGLERQPELPKDALHLLSVLNTLGEGGEENHRVLCQAHGEMRSHFAAPTHLRRPSCAAMMQPITLHQMETLQLHPGALPQPLCGCSPAWDAQLPQLPSAIPPASRSFWAQPGNQIKEMIWAKNNPDIIL